jgi:diguanylate cyclase (GGDEF)-like protein
MGVRDLACPLRILIVDGIRGGASMIDATLRAGLGTETQLQEVSEVEGALDLIEREAPTAVLVAPLHADAIDLPSIARIAERHPALPIVAIGRSTPGCPEAEAIQGGAQAVLMPQDLTPSVLVGTLHQAVQRARIMADLRAAREAARHQAGHDALTGIANRLLFEDRLAQCLAGARRSGSITAVALLDMDRLKSINNVFGHETGDEILRCVAQRLAKQVRESDTAARIGGDEFAFVMSNLGRETDAARVSQKLLGALATPITVRGEHFQVGASIGIAIFGRDGRDADSLLRNADRAMYHAKRAGGSRYQFYTDAMNVEATERMRVEMGLSAASDRSELRLEYQPLIELEQMRVVGAEALLRWRDPSCGWRHPAAFLPVAEETGLIVKIGGWALRAACREARAWSDAGGVPCRVGVNLSARQLSSSGLQREVEAALHESELAPPRLTLEIGERALVEESRAILQTLPALRDKGVRIALDDFGEKHAPIAMLNRVPFDEIKLAPALIAGIGKGGAGADIAAAIISLAHGLGAVCTAESVETADQLDFLREAGCGFAQGFLFSEPLVPEALAQLMGESLPSLRCKKD